MKTTCFMMIAVVAIVTSLWSCEKDFDAAEPVAQEPSSESEELQIDTTMDLSLSAYDADIYQDFSDATLKSAGYGYEYSNGVYEWILNNAKKETDIIPYFFKLDVRYKNSYKHLKQLSDECSWTSYVIAVGCVANAYSCYPVTRKQVNYVRDKCEYLMRKKVDPHASGKLVTTLESFAGKYDVSSRTLMTSYQPESRFETIRLMLSHINNYHTPFLVIGTYYYKNGTKGGHYLVVHSIDWKGTAAQSTIYYTDCSRDDQGGLAANLRTMSFGTFLDQMIIPGKVRNYNMLFVRPNG